jgi:hypothetical protein
MAGGSFQELRPESVLQALHLQRDGRLPALQALCGPRKPSAFHNRHEGAQEVGMDVHEGIRANDGWIDKRNRNPVNNQFQ